MRTLNVQPRRCTRGNALGVEDPWKLVHDPRRLVVPVDMETPFTTAETETLSVAVASELSERHRRGGPVGLRPFEEARFKDFYAVAKAVEMIANSTGKAFGSELAGCLRPRSAGSDTGAVQDREVGHGCDLDDRVVRRRLCGGDARRRQARDCRTRRGRASARTRVVPHPGVDGSSDGRDDLQLEWGGND
jgi:hypothetical protein